MQSVHGSPERGQGYLPVARGQRAKGENFRRQIDVQLETIILAQYGAKGTL